MITAIGLISPMMSFFAVIAGSSDVLSAELKQLDPLTM